MKNKKNNILPSFLVIALIITAFIYFYYKKVYVPQKEEIEKQNAKIARDARQFVIKNIVFDEYLILNENQNQNDIMAKLPLRLKPVDIKNFFEKFIENYKDIKINFNEINNENIKQASIELLNNDEIIFKARFVRNSKPKIAIILDDWGYNKDNIAYLEKIKYPFAVSVFPEHIYSKEIANLAIKNKKLVMLHLPMEPKRKLPPERNTLKINMSEGEIRYILNKFISEMNFIKGVNNHQGSLATTDKRLMNIVTKVLKENNLFFIDSLTDKQSIAFEIAKENNLLTNKRDVFIDNKKEFEYNEQQIEQLKKIAKKKGYAIGIGHDDIITLQALEKNMPLAETEGYEFVYITELLL